LDVEGRGAEEKGEGGPRQAAETKKKGAREGTTAARGPPACASVRTKPSHEKKTRPRTVDEHDDLAVAVGDLLDDGLEAVLKLPAVLGARDERAHVERHERAPLQRRRHVARHDALREALGDGGLPHARLPDQHGVVLGAAREDLDRAADLVVAPDDGVELAVARVAREVARVAREGLVLALRVLVRDLVAPAHVLDRLLELGLGQPLLLEQRLGEAGVVAEREHEVLDRDELVAQLLAHVHGAVDGGLEVAAQDLLRGVARHARLPADVVVGALEQARRVAAGLADEAAGEAVGLLQQRL